MEKALGSGEPVRCRRRLHPVILVPPVVLVAPAALMTVWPSTILLGLAFAGLATGTLAVLTLTTSEIVVTDRRLLGQVHGERFNMPLGHVKRASARIGWFGGLFGFGTLAIDLAVGDGRPMVLRGVVDPEPLATAINDAVTLSGGGPPGGGPGEISPPPGGPGDR